MQSEGSKLGGVEVDRKQIESKLLELKKHKRPKKTATTKVRYNVEKLCALKSFGGRGNGRAYFSDSGGRAGDGKPPCSFCAGNHGVWT